MTHFEYISVAMSIVLSFAVLRLLDAVPHATAADKRYWIHGVWVVFLLLWTAVFWWLTWSHSAREAEFDFRTFLLMVTAPGLLYLCATALVSHAPANVPSWREHFWIVRRRFFGYALALLFCLVFTSFVLQRVPLADPLRAQQAVLLGLFGTGFFSRSERTHGVIAALAVTLAVAILILTIGGWLVLDLESE